MKFESQVWPHINSRFWHDPNTDFESKVTAQGWIYSDMTIGDVEYQLYGEQEQYEF